MLAARITCARCGQELTLTEAAPPQVSCPRCLAALVNPASPQSGLRPVPVIPLDRQVERDTNVSTFLIFGVLLLFGIAAAVTMAGGSLRSGMFVILLLGGLVTFLYFLGTMRADAGAPVQGVALPAPGDVPPPMQTSTGPAVLEYGRGRRPTRTPVTPGAVAGGFFSAIGVCALGFLVLAATADFNPGGFSRPPGTNYHAHILGAVVLAVIGFIVLTVRISGRWRGFGPGAAAGLCLGMIALGPCAACYLLTLK